MSLPPCFAYGGNRAATCMLAVLVALALPASIPFADTVTLSIPELSGKPGTVVELPLEVRNATGLSALQVLMTYDPAVLEYLGAPDGFIRGDIVPQNAILQAETDVPGKLPILFLGGVDGQTRQVAAVQKDGTLATLRFRVIGKAAQNSELGLLFAEAFQASEMDLRVETQAGSFSSQQLLPDWWPWAAGAAGFILLICILRALTGKRTRRPSPRRQPPEPELVAVAADDSIRKKCPGCGKTIRVPPQLVGRSFKCPGCGTANRDPARPVAPRAE